LSITPAVLEMPQETMRFYGVPMPAIVVVLGLTAFVGIWSFAGAVRAFKQLQLIRLSPLPVWGFFASLEAVLVGLCWKGYIFGPHTSTDYFYLWNAIGDVVFYLFINWLALTVLAGGSAITRNQLREWWSAEKDSASVLKRTEIRNIFSAFPIATAISIIGLGAVWYSLNL